MLSDLVKKFDDMDKNFLKGIYSLTDDQQKIHDDIFNTLGKYRYAVLNSSSGSGKTTLIRSIVETAEKRDIACVVTASTGKASSALDGRTIHSFLNLSMVANDKAVVAGEALQLKKKNDVDIVKPKILIIDEASMLGENFIRLILKENFKYILFVLDENQLKPVKDTMVDWSELGDIQYKLTKTLRAQDPDLLKLFHDFKDYREGRIEELSLYNYVNNRNIVTIDYSEVDHIPANSNSCFVAYRNKLVEKMANDLTLKNHDMYNLNRGVTVTKMVVTRVKGVAQYNGNYLKRSFEDDFIAYNGEDVTIERLDSVMRGIQNNGYAMHGDYKISLSKKKNSLIISNMRDEFADNFFIQFPPDKMLEKCTLSLIEDYYVLVYDENEEDFKSVLDLFFQELLPYLTIKKNIDAYFKGKVDITILPADIIESIQINSKDDFFDWYAESEYTYFYKRGWSRFLSASKVVSARESTSRTINKAQGISVPCVIIGQESFFGASLAAQYVAVTRGKHGLILIENMPIILQKVEDEQF